MPAQTPYVRYQEAVTLRNHVSLSKETLKIVPDGHNPGKFLVTFMFDAAVAGSITVMFLAKEGEDCNLTSMKEDIFKPVTVDFEKGLRQNFRQPAGTGIDLSALEEELLKLSEMDVYPLAIKAEALPDNQTGAKNCQITRAVIECQVRVLKQILWVNNKRYDELQEIYQTGNSMEGDLDGNNWGKECAICLSEPCDTIVLPCRHMVMTMIKCCYHDIDCMDKKEVFVFDRLAGKEKCMCNGCAKVLMFQTDRCPICRQPADKLSRPTIENVIMQP